MCICIFDGSRSLTGAFKLVLRPVFSIVGPSGCPCCNSLPGGLNDRTALHPMDAERQARNRISDQSNRLLVSRVLQQMSLTRGTSRHHSSAPSVPARARTSSTFSNFSRQRSEDHKRRRAQGYTYQVLESVRSRSRACSIVRVWHLIWLAPAGQRTRLIRK